MKGTGLVAMQEAVANEARKALVAVEPKIAALFDDARTAFVSKPDSHEDFQEGWSA